MRALVAIVALASGSGPAPVAHDEPRAPIVSPSVARPMFGDRLVRFVVPPAIRAGSDPDPVALVLAGR